MKMSNVTPEWSLFMEVVLRCIMRPFIQSSSVKSDIEKIKTFER